MNRLGIFYTCDNEGFVDDYIVFMLREIKKILSHLTVVCKNTLLPESHEILNKITSDIVVESNANSNIEAWRSAIIMDRENFYKYDELILLDDSFYGPIYSLDKIFSEMDKNYSDADFWGITIHGERYNIPEHIQEYFLVFRNKIFHSEDFYIYWQNPKKFFMTKNFSDKNFKYAVYCDTRNFEKNYDLKIDHCIFSAERLLKFYNCPILKKEVFQISRENYLKENYGMEPQKCLDFINNNTTYDVNLIWKNILHENNLALIKSNLALNYVLSSEKDISISGEILKETAVIAHLYYEDLMANYVKYLCRIPKEIFVIVTVDSERKKILVEKIFSENNRKCEVRIVAKRGRDIAALLVGCADIFDKFKYLCFVHDKKSVRKNESVMIGKAFSDLIWDNVLSSETFIRNIIATFENESCLGLLVPPQPYHGGYESLFFEAKFWSSDCYKKTLELADKIDVPKKFFNIKFAPPAIGTVFWCRTESLKKITAVNWKVEDFPSEPIPNDGTINHALERILPFAAQAQGFYTGHLFNERFAKTEIENFICLSEVYYRLQKKFPTIHATIYFDERGEKFIEQNVLIEDSGSFNAKFFYTASESIKYLRFDPDDNFISIKLKNFTINGEKYNFNTNGAELVEEFYNFMTSDPQFIFEIGSLQGNLVIEISGAIKFNYLQTVSEKILFMRDEKILLEENHKQERILLEEKINRLENKLAELKKLNDNILNSTSWKITAPLRKISKIIR